MGRSRQAGAFSDLLDVASKLPWKVSLGIAAISLLGFHLLAAAFAPTPTVTTVADMGGVVIHQGIHVFASIFQYVIPMAFVIGASVSYLKRSRSIELFENARSSPASDVSSLSGNNLRSSSVRDFGNAVSRSRKKGEQPRTAALISSSHAALSASWCSVSSGEPSKYPSPSCVSCMASWRPSRPPAAMS
jgi:hypothetical protein